jgi:hypothetical protein
MAISGMTSRKVADLILEVFRWLNNGYKRWVVSDTTGALPAELAKKPHYVR